MASWRHILSIGLSGATLGIVLAYALGAQVILQSPYAEQGHELFMSLTQGIAGGHSSMAQLHGGPMSGQQEQQQMQEMQTRNQLGIIGNNMLGSPEGVPAAGLAAVIIMGVIPLAIAAFLISWKQRSFVVAGLLAASGVILMILPLTNMNFVIPGPIIGVIVGLMILGFGVAKGIKTASAATAVTK